MTRAARLLALLSVTLVAGCAYFNALYNARRLYGEAETAAGRGNTQQALAAYRESLDKAARSLERDPDGRWSDDALLLIGQNQFGLGNCPAARAALERVLAETRDAALAARARAYLGASHQCLGEPMEALAQLNSALPDLERGGTTAAFARLWRARARFALDSADGAWSDLREIAERDDAIGRAALLEQISRAIQYERPELAIAGFHGLFDDPYGDLHADSMIRLARATSSRLGGVTARAALEPAGRAPWAGDVRDNLVVERARQAALAGDTASAMRELEQASSRSAAAAANEARIELARLRIATATDPSALAEIRAILLPALADQRARSVVNNISVIGMLLGYAAEGQPLALFAAAEAARDRLGARNLARRLFLAYADVAGGTPWASKAVIAALALDPTDAERTTLSSRLSLANDMYALAARGSSAPGYEDAENRLDQTLTGLVARAQRDAVARDLAVGAAVAQMDSITAAVRADSTALACGVFADSVGLAGIRRDSVTAACLRSDVALVDSFMRVDTLVWIDSTGVVTPPGQQDEEQPQS